MCISYQRQKWKTVWLNGWYVDSVENSCTQIVDIAYGVINVVDSVEKLCTRVVDNSSPNMRYVDDVQKSSTTFVEK